MEIKVNLEISLSPALIAFLTGLASPGKPAPAEGIDFAAAQMKKTITEDKAAEEKTTKPAKPTKPAAAKKEKETIDVSTIRQYAAATPERKAALRTILEGLDLEEPKLQFLPEELYSTVFQQLKDAEI